jgi:HAD superfamily hydrolase (TIGR01450 family)
MPRTAKHRAVAATAPLAGIRGMLLDLDGVLVLQGAAIPGAPEAMAELDRRRLPYRVVTNTSLVSRDTLSSWGRRVGLEIPPERILSALSASAAFTARTYPGRPLFVIASEDARKEFVGQRLMIAAEADTKGAQAAAVVIGDSPEEATYDNLNRAFRLVRGGARLIGMHKNRWWLTPAGPTLDSGAFVAGLEYAASVRALVLGKPSPAFFREAADELLVEIAARGSSPSNGGPVERPSRRDLAMVGDDLWTDVLAAQRLGLRGVFVLTGKHGRDELDQAAASGRGGGMPDFVARSVTEVIAALD